MFKFFLVVCLYLPFQLALNPVLGVDLASIRILIPVLFISLFFNKLEKGKEIFSFDTQEKLILSFLFLSAISVFFAQNYIWGLRKLLYLMSIFPLYFVVKNIINTKEKASKIIKYLVFSGAIVSFIGIIQFLAQFLWSHEQISNFYLKFIGPIFWGENLTRMVAEHSSWLVSISNQNYFRAISIFPDPHTFSMFLGMLLPLALSLFLLFGKKKLWFFITLLLFIADILTFSRGAYLGVITGSLIFISFFWKKIEMRNRLVVSVGVVLFFLVLVVSPVSQRLFSSFDLQEGSNVGRLKMWQKSIDIMKQRPLFGTGLGNFSLSVTEDVTYRNPIYAHNTYLDVAVETGILTGVIWILILALTIRRFWLISKKDPLYIGLLSSLIIFSTHSLVETSIYSPVVLSLFIILISFYSQYEKR